MHGFLYNLLKTLVGLQAGQLTQCRQGQVIKTQDLVASQSVD